KLKALTLKRLTITDKAFGKLLKSMRACRRFIIQDCDKITGKSLASWRHARRITSFRITSSSLQTTYVEQALRHLLPPSAPDKDVQELTIQFSQLTLSDHPQA